MCIHLRLAFFKELYAKQREKEREKKKKKENTICFFTANVVESFWKITFRIGIDFKLCEEKNKIAKRQPRRLCEIVPSSFNPMEGVIKVTEIYKVYNLATL